MSSLEKKNCCKGFMLLEVILSVLIIATGVLFIMRSYSASIKASDISRRLTRACLFLEDKLFDIDAKGFREGIGAQEYNDTEGDYSWTFIAQPDDKEKITDVNLKLIWKGHVIDIVTLRRYKES